MPRVKRGTKRNDRRKKILKRASGYFLTKSKLYQAAQEAVERGMKFAYSGRKQKKRQFRSLWIVRINAAAKLNGISYSQLHQRPEEGRNRAGSQDPGRHRRERRRRLYRAGRAGQSRAGKGGCVGAGWLRSFNGLKLRLQAIVFEDEVGLRGLDREAMT